MTSEVKRFDTVKMAAETRKMVEMTTEKVITLTNQELADMAQKTHDAMDPLFEAILGDPKKLADSGINGTAKLILFAGIISNFGRQLQETGSAALAADATPKGLMLAVRQMIDDEILSKTGGIRG